MGEILEKTQIYASIGKLCRERRKQKGLSSNAVAKILKIQPSGYNRFENGLRSLNPDNLKKVLDFYGFKVVFNIEQDFIPHEHQGKKKITCPSCLARFLV